MDVELSRRALDLFEEALDRPELMRVDWITEICGDDVALRAEVMRLVHADQGDIAGILADGIQIPTTLAAPPERVGAYRITDLLGVGGMGATYAAQRADGLFEHEVAIKILRPSLLPETSRALFDKERRALAKLSHRNIAQLFDGGVTDAGAPYFVMERVRGETLDAWAMSRSAREIVRALIDVCDAVQFAHHNLIVHADIKPANVLVNDNGDPKVIDFGVARMLHDDEAGQAFPFTPHFASPARKAGAAPSPADDVFGLGATARVLLEGKATEARADLDAIIERALSDDPAMRHGSVASLQDDFRRWLDFRPIGARSAERFYVARKFLRRRRLRVAVAGFAAFGLIAGLAITSLLYVRAEQQRQIAEARFGEVRQMARYLLFDFYDKLERTPRSLATRRDIARVGQTYLQQLAASPGAPDIVRHETIDGLMRIAEIQAGRHHANLGEYEAAKANLAEADRIAGAFEAGAEIDAMRARIALRQANIAMNVDQDLAAAEAFVQAANGLRGGADPLLDLDIAVETATLRNWQGRHAEARDLARNFTIAFPDGAEQSREEAFLRFRLQDALAEAEYYLGDLAIAEEAYRRYAELTTSYWRAHPQDMEALRNEIRARWALGTTLLARGRGAESLDELQEAARLLPALLDFEPDDEASQRLNRVVLAARAQALALTGRFDAAAALLRAQVDEREAHFRAAPHEAARARTLAISLAMLADLYADNGRARTSCAYYARSETLMRQLESKRQLTPQDRDNALAMVLSRRAQHCR